MKRLLLAAMLIAASTNFSQAQLKLPSLSPTTKVTQDFSLSTIEINYSRPSIRGRKIFGDVVQYGNVWRTGANSASKIKFGEDVDINGVKVKAGEYALYSIPDKESWEIILNTGTGNWGAGGYSKENDVLRFNVKPVPMEGVCQTFTIGISDISYTSCKLEMMWERVKIQIPIVAHNEEGLTKNIDKAINHPSIPYFQVANYYNENNIKLELAESYVDKALEEDPKAFFVWALKAKIEKKLGHNDKAIEAANKSIEVSAGTPFEAEYQHNNTKLINDIKKGENFSTKKHSY
jgi:hypothetical protein